MFQDMRPAPFTRFGVVFFLLAVLQHLWKTGFITSAVVLFSRLSAVISCKMEMKLYFPSLRLSHGSQ